MANSIWAQPEQREPMPIDPSVIAALAGATAKMPPVFAPPAPVAPSLSPDVARGLGGDGGNAPLPQVFSSNRPQVRMPTAMENATSSEEGRLQKLVGQDEHAWGTPENHPGKLGKLGHVLSTIGNVAGNIFAPSTMALIPGTQLNRQVEEGGLIRQLNAESMAKQQEALSGSQVAHNQAETGLENEQIEEMKNPKGKPPAGTKWEREVIPGQGIYDINPETHEAFPVTASGKPLVPPAAAAKQPTDAFDEWMRDPSKYQEFMAAMNQAKPSKALQGAYGGFGPAMLASRMLNAAYSENPALLPVLAPMLAKMLQQPGETPEQTQALESTIAKVPTGQPQNAEGTAIGLRMPEAPTGGTRSRGQFAQAVLPSIAQAKKEIDGLGVELGPMQGRWNEMYVSKVGAFGPQYSKLQTELKNIGTAWMRLHANSESARQEFEGVLRGAQSPANLEANLDAIAEQAQDYVKEGQGKPGELGGGAAGPKAGDVVDGYKFKGGNASDQKNWEQVK